MSSTAADGRPAMIKVRAAERNGRWASGVGQAAASASDRVGEAVQDLPGAGQAQRSVRAIADAVSDQDPLLLAAIGLAFGTALGSMLPGTRLEDETFGGVGKVLSQGPVRLNSTRDWRRSRRQLGTPWRRLNRKPRRKVSCPRASVPPLRTGSPTSSMRPSTRRTTRCAAATRERAVGRGGGAAAASR